MMNFSDIGEKKRRKTYIKKHFPEEYKKIIDFNKNLDIDNFSQILYHYNYNINIIPKCKICNNSVKFINFIQGYRIYCSTKCSMSDKNIVKNRNIKSKETCINKYGVNNVMKVNNIVEKNLESNKKNHNGKIAASTKKVKEKIKKTNLERYGVDNFMKTEEFKKKKLLTCLKKYGVDNYTKSDVIKEKIKKTNLEKYGAECYFQSEKCKNDIQEKYNGHHMTYKKNNNLLDNFFKKQTLIYYKNLLDNNYSIINISNNDIEIKHHVCGNNFIIKKQQLYLRNKINTEICLTCNKLNEPKKEKEIYNYLNLLNINIIQNNKNIINPYELDAYLPDLNLAFEFNGLYWHNELYKDKNYHLNKTNLCEEKGIQLIHIWEDDWIYKQNIVKSMILNKLGKTPNKIYARKTKVKEIVDNKLVREFLNKNHIQGFIGSRTKLGLFYDNELVSLMTFGKRRVAMGKKSTNEGEWELLRFCNKLNTNVIGGASKLFKYFINNYNPKNITTYSDRSYSQGKLYEKLGFSYQGKTPPNYYYIIDGIKHHRFNFRKDKLIKEGYDFNKTEHEIMLDRNIYRIYDSGNLKYELNF